MISPTPLALRPMTRDDYSAIAHLIHTSTNAWYAARGGGPIFTCAPEECGIFCDVYDGLENATGFVVEDTAIGQIVGSCFYHSRPTHVSVGIVNTHPDYFGRGVARRMLQAVISVAEADGKPVRLVSSALNLDSFSLYTRLGFVPRQAFQDMVLAVPDAGLPFAAPVGAERVRPATRGDAPALADLESSVSGIHRENDLRFFAENRQGIWNLLTIEDEMGNPAGYLASVDHPASCMIGPGVARTEADALALLHAQLDHLRGKTPVFLAPVTATRMVQTCYGWGARNVEIHFAQVRGHWRDPTGVVMPSFLPESG